MKALPKILLALTAVAAFSLAHPASVHAVPTTYHYTGNPFTFAVSPYTTSDFVTAMITLASPLAPNFSGHVTPTAFALFDGVQTITNLHFSSADFFFRTGPKGQITGWDVFVTRFFRTIEIVKLGDPLVDGDLAETGPIGEEHFASNSNPGTWSVADTGSTLSLMTLTLMALGLAARRFKRAAA
jgi:hypothetical protein